MRAAGESVRAYKPIVTGLAEPPGEWPHDHEVLALAAGMAKEDVAAVRFDPPVSPHLAAAMAGRQIDPGELVAGACAGSADVLVVEGVGGLLVPLTGDFSVRDLAGAIGLPLVIASSAELGTINHTLLTIAALREAKIPIAGIVVNRYPVDGAGVAEETNLRILEKWSRTPLLTVAPDEPFTWPDLPKGVIAAMERVDWERFAKRE